MRLSAIVIACNEADNIADCLDSLSFCDERIVVDAGSSDATVDIAIARGAEVRFNPWPGFGAQKNHALSLASGEWVLSVDADERVSLELAAEILTAIDGATVDGFEIPRRSRFCGKVMRHSGWWPDHVLRLFRRGCGRFSDDIVHERVIADGPVARLRNPIEHLARTSLENVLARVDRYSTLGAEELTQNGRRVPFRAGIMHGLGGFLKTYVLRLGFLDGREGFLLAVANGEVTFYKYMKAWVRQRRGEPDRP